MTWNTTNEMPKEDGMYLVTVKEHNVDEQEDTITYNTCIARYYINKLYNTFTLEVEDEVGYMEFKNVTVLESTYNGFYSKTEVTAWMELPKPYLSAI